MKKPVILPVIRRDVVEARPPLLVTRQRSLLLRPRGLRPFCSETRAVHQLDGKTAMLFADEEEVPLPELTLYK